MDKSNEKEGMAVFAAKSELERTLQAGIQGAPELKGEEKARYLGEFRERVLRILTKRQAGESQIYPEIEAALKDPRASVLVINGDLHDNVLRKYKKLAEASGVPVTSRRAAEYAGDTGLLVAASHAVDVEQIEVAGRRERLLKKGLPEQLIDAVGEEVCKDCYALIREKAPEELDHYRQIGAIGRLFGEKCPGHE